MEFKTPYLIQRLKKPYEQPEPSLLVSMIEGLSGTSLPKAVADALRSVMRFDYMGSAEFEFGTVPAALKKTATSIESYIAGRMNLEASEIGFRKMNEGRFNPPTENKTVYYFCHKDHQNNVMETIRALAKDAFSIRLKELTYFDEALLDRIPDKRYAVDVDFRPVGWFDLDNCYFFFTDEKMFRNTLALFGKNIQAEGT